MILPTLGLSRKKKLPCVVEVHNKILERKFLAKSFKKIYTFKNMPNISIVRWSK